MTGDVNDWVKKEFQTVNFGSKRLEKRFLRVMSDLAQEPEKSIWLATGSRANAKAAYRMIGNEEFTKENILAAHQTATNNRNQDNILLAIQDTTTLNYDTHK
ncbi:MAG: transposase, partial [Nitrososphaerota archaeon]|nr:transposase [Nitrososphaerota archaeon]